ncbi:MAG: hypothetical protein VX784_14210, partial [Pseudomonadota bacterium]|nr:hypothetical protein [Pseudomonadota bacterium]
PPAGHPWGNSMALRPPGPGSPGGPRRPPPRRAAAVRPAAPSAPPPRRPAPRRLPTATSRADVEAQIMRLLDLLANNALDRGAPRGSYLNLLV